LRYIQICKVWQSASALSSIQVCRPSSSYILAFLSFLQNVFMILHSCF